MFPEATLGKDGSVQWHHHTLREMSNFVEFTGP